MTWPGRGSLTMALAAALVGLVPNPAASPRSPPELHDCPPERRSLLSLAGFARMPEDRVARFSYPPEMRCQDVHLERIIAYPSPVRRGGRQAFEWVATFAEHPPAGVTLRHRLKIELLRDGRLVAQAEAPAWTSSKPTRSVAKITFELGAGPLADFLANREPQARVTFTVRRDE